MKSTTTTMVLLAGTTPATAIFGNFFQSLYNWKTSLINSRLPVYTPPTVPAPAPVPVPYTSTTFCEMLAKVYPSITVANGTTDYMIDNTDFWTAAAALGPKCIFRPTTAADMGKVVALLATSKTVPFAIRGGGHMPIAGSNNIGSEGVLLSSSNFNEVKFGNADKSTVHIGVGLQWYDVYKFLEAHNLAVVGGRVGVVGIPGYFLGGGISFMANQYGWAVNSVVSFTCILANGQVVTASKQENPDLFWALKGGGNSFAIVTNIEVKTHPVQKTTIGDVIFGPGVKDKWIAGVVGITKDTGDEKYGAVPQATMSNLAGIPGVFYGCQKFYNGNGDMNPAVFKDFSAPNMPILSDGFAVKSLASYANEFVQLAPRLKGLRNRFFFININPDPVALALVHDLYFKMAVEAGIEQFPAYSLTMAAMGMPPSFARNAKALGGDAMDVEEVGQIWIEFSSTFARPTEEPVIDKLMREFDTAVTAALVKNGTPRRKFHYINDIDGFQQSFSTYPQASLQRLKTIRAQYDPNSVFTELMPGGFKVRNA